ncbi:MAG: GAF domain-containing sensor histidine kinase [Actinobacteria bacterium]|nr:MAG: GAF domain-containing sensor histidine kinase [Actinomycetota bacterium]
MPKSVWSTQQLAEFLAAVSSCETEASAALAAVERAAEALEAEVAAIVCGGEIVAAVGYPEGAVPAAELISVAAGGGELAVPGVGTCPATRVALDHPPGGILVLARTGSDSLSGPEGSLLRGMASVTSLTMRMLRLLDDERAAREESDRQAAERARLLATLSQRTTVLERLAEEQAALRRVATLVADQAGADDIFTAVAEEVTRLLRANMGGVARYGADQSLTLVAEWHEGSAGLPVGMRLDQGNDIERLRDLWSGRPVRLTNYEGMSDLVVSLARELGIHSTVGAPILVDGAVWGSIYVNTTKPEPFPADTEARVMGFAELVATAISNAVSRSQLAASRARVVGAADETRRRIERDLHDGIQQRLVSLALELRFSEEGMPAHQIEAKRAVARVADGLTDALDEVRELARGIHPAILSEGGLRPALKALARRSAVPVELEVDVETQLPERVEVATYFVVSEALANAAKHARASVAHVRVTAAGSLLQVSIRDDGLGGADPSRGSGLIGLTDRVQALGGTLSVLSPPGQGTTIQVELPAGDG